MFEDTMTFFLITGSELKTITIREIEKYGLFLGQKLLVIQHHRHDVVLSHFPSLFSPLFVSSYLLEQLLVYGKIEHK